MAAADDVPTPTQTLFSIFIFALIYASLFHFARKKLD